MDELEILSRPAMYSSSAMKVTDTREVNKLRKKKTLVAQSVDLCLQYWNIDRMIEFMDVLDYHARFLPSLATSRSYKKVDAQAP